MNASFAKKLGLEILLISAASAVFSQTEPLQKFETNFLTRKELLAINKSNTEIFQNKLEIKEIIFSTNFVNKSNYYIDTTGDGFVDKIIEIEYKEKKKYIKEDFNLDGKSDFIISYNYYNTGKIRKKTIERINNALGRNLLIEIEYNKDGKKIFQRIDENGDKNFDSIISYKYENDELIEKRHYNSESSTPDIIRKYYYCSGKLVKRETEFYSPTGKLIFRSPEILDKIYFNMRLEKNSPLKRVQTKQECSIKKIKKKESVKIIETEKA